MNVLHLITARGGSKGVENKNIQQIGGIPLLGYKAISANRSKYCDRLILSSDSPEIISVAKQYSVEVPFVRPASLATDTASSMDVISHALDFIETEEGNAYDAVMLLEPSTPFARAEDLNRAVELMKANDAALVVSLVRHKIHPIHIGPLAKTGQFGEVVQRLDQLKSTNRQELSPQYTMNGGVYLFRWDIFKEHGSIYADSSRSFGFVMPSEYSVEIDEREDLDWAEYLVASGKVDMGFWT